MNKILLFVLFSAFFQFSDAATIQGMTYDPSNSRLQVALTYQGGLMTHDFSLDWDQCQTLDGVQEIAARLIDSGWNDTGTENYSQVVSFDLSRIACKPAYLTLFSDRHSRGSIWIE